MFRLLFKGFDCVMCAVDRLPCLYDGDAMFWAMRSSVCEALHGGVHWRTSTYVRGLRQSSQRRTGGMSPFGHNCLLEQSGGVLRSRLQHQQSAAPRFCASIRAAGMAIPQVINIGLYADDGAVCQSKNHR